MATAKLKRKHVENPDSQKSSLIKLLILKKCSFALSFVSLLMGTYPAAAAATAARRTGTRVLGGHADSTAKRDTASSF